MPDYVVLMKLTAQGAKDIDDAPSRIARAKAGWKALGGELRGFYITMGEYDYVAVGTLNETDEAADQMALAFALQLAREGNVMTTTMKAFSEGTLEALLRPEPLFVRKGPASPTA